MSFSDVLQFREQRLFSEIPGIYTSTKEDPNAIRAAIRMRDLIDPDDLRWAVDMTVKRYPYFCVELRRTEKDGWMFTQNSRPVILRHFREGAALNSPESNHHMLAFSWFDNWIIVDIFHGLTDGKGSYALIRTLLCNYCFRHYHMRLPGEGVRLVGDQISEEEWIDPLPAVPDVPIPAAPERKPVLKLTDAPQCKGDHRKSVYCVTLSESEFMRFCRSNGGSPATMVALLLSRAIARLFPDSTDAIRIGLYADWRTALHLPLAHQCLVGTILLDYYEKLRTWPVDKQLRAYREMVSAQMREDIVLARLASDKALVNRILTAPSEEERLSITDSAVNGNRFCASVSYIEKANFQEAERYIRTFRIWTSTTTSPLLIEISAVSGQFFLDVIQNFSSPFLINALLAEFEENGIDYDLLDLQALKLPEVRLPWTVDSTEG